MELGTRRKAAFLVCSASAELTERMRELLRSWACGECVMLSAEFVPAFPDNTDGIDLLFLDMDSVAVPDRESLGIGRTVLIVISGDAGNAIRSYRWHPAAFLKPGFGARELGEALDAGTKAWQEGRICLETLYHRRQLRLPLGSVRYVEAYRNYCVLNQKRQSIRLRLPLSALEEAVPKPPFFRCHKSYLVHLAAVEAMSYTELRLREDGSRLPIGRKYHEALRQALEMWKRGDFSW